MVAEQGRRNRAREARWEREMRDARIRDLAAEGMTGLAIARRLGLRMRTVCRALEAGR